MCYLVAKNFKKPGCIVYEIERENTLSALIKYLSLKTLEKDIQVLTDSAMEVFSEYKPNNLIESEGGFNSKVLEM